MGFAVYLSLGWNRSLWWGTFGISGGFLRIGRVWSVRTLHTDVQAATSAGVR
jgi:hypothetical protein